MITPPRSDLRRATPVVLAALVLSGCFTLRKEAESNELIDVAKVERLEAETADPSFRSTRLDAAGLRPSTAPLRRISRQEAIGGRDDVAVAAAPETPPSTAGAPASPVISRPSSSPAAPPTVVVAPIDALVGQISGRPLFASDFFAPMDARMQAEADRVDRREFLQNLREQVVEALRDVIRDELLLAEFEASLSPQQRQGIAFFVEGIRDNLIRQSGGSTELANQSLLSEEGLTLDEKVEAESRQQLVRQMVGRLLRNRAWIPWRDVRRDYLRNLDEFRPAPTARLRVIMTPATDAQLLASVAQELAAGEPFAEVAERHSVFRPEQGGLYETALAPEGYASTQFFADDTLNQNAVTLSQGDIVGPFDWADRRVWMTLERLTADGVSLYESQETILARLRQQRLAEVQGEFFLKLQRRGSLSDIDVMEAELFRLGAERYLISGKAPAPSED